MSIIYIEVTYSYLEVWAGDFYSYKQSVHLKDLAGSQDTCMYYYCTDRKMRCVSLLVNLNLHQHCNAHLIKNYCAVDIQLIIERGLKPKYISQ